MLASDIFLLALFVLHFSQAIALASFQMLAQSFEFDCLGLPIVILKQSLGFLLGESLLILQLHELFVLSGHASRVGQITPVLCD